MMSVSVTNFDLEDKSLSLIDFCDEDDCLYVSPPRDHPSLRISDDQKEQKSVKFDAVQASRDSIEGDEQAIQPFESSDEKKTKKNEKYNLRKSLAWDNAFFTSAGVLEPEELSTMISGVVRGHKRFELPGIEEEICRSSESICTVATDKSTLGTLEDDLSGDIRASIQKSSKACHEIRKAEKSEDKLASTGFEEDISRLNDSISTLATENLTLGTLEDDLFGDIRASIQKSSKASRALSQGKLASGVNASQLIKSLEKVGAVSQNKLMTKAALKKPSVVTKGSGKMMNKVAPSAEGSKCGSRTGESASSLSKPPKIIARAHSFSAVPTKRASLSGNCIKVEKDNAKALTLPGRGTKVPANGASRYGVPKPQAPVKSSLRSSVASKTQLTPSSSIDSFGSLSSHSSKNSSEIEKRKIDSNTGNCSSISSTGRRGSTTTRIAQSRNPSMISRMSPLLQSLTKPSSSVSPSSSISDWSSESLSPTSTLNNRSDISKPSIDSSSWKNASNRTDACQTSGSENHSNDNCSAENSTRVTGLLNKSAKRVSPGNGALNHPEAIKPSGLRMPSPKIGFFDGAKSTVRTPTGSLKSPTVPSNLARCGSGNVSPGRGLKEAKREKLQPARMVMTIRGTKSCAQKNASETKPKTPLPLQEASNISPKVLSGSRAGKNHPSVPLKLQNKKSPGKEEQFSLNAENIASKESETAISNPDLCDSERSNGHCKDTITSHDEGNNSGKNEETSTLIGRSSALCNLNPVNIAKESNTAFRNSDFYCSDRSYSLCKDKVNSYVGGNHSGIVEDTPTVDEGSWATCNSNSMTDQEGEVRSQKNDMKAVAEIKPKSPKPLQEATNCSPTVRIDSRTGKHSPVVTLKVQNAKDERCHLNDEILAAKESNIVISNSESCNSERRNCLRKDKLSSYSERNNSEKVDIPTVGGPSATCNASYKTVDDGGLCSHKNDLRPTSEIKTWSSLHIQEASNLSLKVFSGSKTGKQSPGMPLEIQNKKSPEKDKRCNLNAESISTEDSKTAMNNPHICSSERSKSLCMDKMGSLGEGNDSAKVVEISILRGSSVTCKSSSASMKEGEICSQESNLNYFNSSKKEKNSVHVEVDGLGGQLGECDMLGHVQPGAQSETVNAPKPAPSNGIPIEAAKTVDTDQS